MTVNALNCDTDINALLRQIAVTFSANLTWREERSYMLARLSNINTAAKELQFTGYIKNNCLNTKRLMHITGVSAQ